MKNDIFCLIDLSISHLLFYDELKRVGVKCCSDFLAPVAVDAVKLAIKKQIRNCNLSKEAHDELLLDLHKQGVNIQADVDIFPDPAKLPQTFSKGIVKLLVEQQRAMNLASWFLHYFLAEVDIDSLTELLSPDYPNNLSQAVYDEMDRVDKHPELIPEEEIEYLLYTIPALDAELILVLFKYKLTVVDVICALSLPPTSVLQWGFEKKIDQIKQRAIRRLYKNYICCLVSC